MSLRTWSGTRLSLTLLAWECLGLVIPFGVWASATGRQWLATHLVRGRSGWAFARFGPPLTLAYVILWLVLPGVVLLLWRWRSRTLSAASVHGAV